MTTKVDPGTVRYIYENAKRELSLSENCVRTGKEEERLHGVTSAQSATPLSTGNRVDGGGLRHNTGKLPVDLVPPSAIFGMAKVLEAGAKKYEARNWERGMKWTTVYASLMRHLLKWMNGEDVDPESGCSHMEHVLCNAAFLVEYEKTCPHLDDRHKKGYNNGR